jgi:hypothetical protein
MSFEQAPFQHPDPKPYICIHETLRARPGGCRQADLTAVLKTGWATGRGPLRKEPASRI